jgi:hypothetical protein
MRFHSAALFTILTLAYSLNASADLLTFTFDTGRTWKLNPETHSQFKIFLEHRRELLVASIPNLYFPKAPLNPADFSKVFMGTSKDYVNRATACSFLQRMRETIKGETSELELRELTADGKICIQADLPPDRWTAWTRKLANFIWTEKWIKKGHEKLSLEDLLISQIGVGIYQKPKIKILSNRPIDGFGYGLSEKDKHFIQDHLVLKKIFDQSRNIDLNNLSTFPELGSELASLFKLDSYNYGEPFIQEPTILISNSWPPDALVELLVHEYGHIYHMLSTSRFSGNVDEIVYFNDHLHFEGVAEAFAWTNLRDLYKTYPEIEIFHIYKLKFFADLKPTDNHYVGAAALSRLFHTTHIDATSFEVLSKLADTPNLGTFLEINNITTLKDDGAKPSTKVKLDIN